MVVLHVFRDSECDAGGWVGHKWQFQRDVIIEQSLSYTSEVHYDRNIFIYFYMNTHSTAPLTKKHK